MFWLKKLSNWLSPHWPRLRIRSKISPKSRQMWYQSKMRWSLSGPIFATLRPPSMQSKQVWQYFKAIFTSSGFRQPRCDGLSWLYVLLTGNRCPTGIQPSTPWREGHTFRRGAFAIWPISQQCKFALLSTSPTDPFPGNPRSDFVVWRNQATDLGGSSKILQVLLPRRALQQQKHRSVAGGALCCHRVYQVRLVLPARARLCRPPDSLRHQEIGEALICPDMVCHQPATWPQ